MSAKQAAISRSRHAVASDHRTFAADVIAGLMSEKKSIPCKYFYDQHGSQLFDKICELEQYYPTRTELEITERYDQEMADAIGTGAAIVEYGSGSSLKTRLLLDALDRPVAYVPVDISEEHLHAASRQIALDYPAIDVLPVAADFTRPFDLPDFPREPTHAAVYFPGSTIGNFETADAVSVLRSTAETCGEGGGVLIGFDLAKDPQTIHDAYNDRDGVTRAFNKNLLVRINRELAGDLDLDAFEHQAEYSLDRGRVEIGLLSTKEQVAQIAGETISFAAGETIHTEYSHKYTREAFANLMDEAGFEVRCVWTDDKDWFAVAHGVVR